VSSTTSFLQLYYRAHPPRRPQRSRPRPRPPPVRGLRRVLRALRSRTLRPAYEALNRPSTSGPMASAFSPRGGYLDLAEGPRLDSRADLTSPVRDSSRTPPAPPSCCHHRSSVASACALGRPDRCTCPARSSGRSRRACGRHHAIVALGLRKARAAAAGRRPRRCPAWGGRPCASGARYWRRICGSASRAPGLRRAAGQLEGVAVEVNRSSPAGPCPRLTRAPSKRTSLRSSASARPRCRSPEGERGAALRGDRLFLAIPRLTPGIGVQLAQSQSPGCRSFEADQSWNHLREPPPPPCR